MSDLLTLQDIADMHRCSTRHARDVIIRTPGFPPPVPTSTKKRRLWHRADVHAFLRRKPARIPHDSIQVIDFAHA